MKKRTIPGGDLDRGLVEWMKRLAARCETLAIKKSMLILL